MEAIRAAGRHILGAARGVSRFFSKPIKLSGKYMWVLHRYTKALIAISVALCVLLLVALLQKQQVRDSVHWRYWSQVVTGNWSPDQPTEQKPANGDHLSTDEYVYGVFVAT